MSRMLRPSVKIAQVCFNDNHRLLYFRHLRQYNCTPGHLHCAGLVKTRPFKLEENIETRRQLGRPHITWLSTVQQDLKQHHLMLPEAADLAQNRPLWRIMSTYGATQS